MASDRWTRQWRCSNPWRTFVRGRGRDLTLDLGSGDRMVLRGARGPDALRLPHNDPVVEWPLRAVGRHASPGLIVSWRPVLHCGGPGRAARWHASTLRRRPSTRFGASPSRPSASRTSAPSRPALAEADHRPDRARRFDARDGRQTGRHSARRHQCESRLRRWSWRKPPCCRRQTQRSAGSGKWRWHHHGDVPAARVHQPVPRPE